MIKPRKWKTVNNIDCCKSLAIFGGGGGGKSNGVCMNLVELGSKKILMTSKNNSAVDTMRKYAERYNLDAECHTIHHCLNLDINGNKTRSDFDMTKFDTIVFDEFFTTDKHLLRKVVHKLREFQGVIILIGDTKQNSYLLEDRTINGKSKKCWFQIPV